MLDLTDSPQQSPQYEEEDSPSYDAVVVTSDEKRKRKLGLKYKLYPGEHEEEMDGNSQSRKKKGKKGGKSQSQTGPSSIDSTPVKLYSAFTRTMPPKLPTEKEARELMVDSSTLQEGQLIEVRDCNNIYCPAKVLKLHYIINNQSQKTMTSFTVRYIGWKEEFDEMIPSPTNRVMPMATYTYKIKAWVNFGPPIQFWPCLVTVRRALRDDEAGHKEGFEHLEEQKRVFVEACGPTNLDPVKRMLDGFWFPTAMITPFEKEKSKKISICLSKARTSVAFKKALEEIISSNVCNFAFAFKGSRESKEDSERDVYISDKAKRKLMIASGRTASQEISNSSKKQRLPKSTAPLQKKPRKRASKLATNILNYGFDFTSSSNVNDSLTEDAISKIVFSLCENKTTSSLSVVGNDVIGVDGLDRLGGWGVGEEFDISMFSNHITEDNYEKFYK